MSNITHRSGGFTCHYLNYVVCSSRVHAMHYTMLPSALLTTAHHKRMTTSVGRDSVLRSMLL